MCFYFTKVVFTGCLHSFRNERLPASQRITFDLCLEHSNDYTAAREQYMAGFPGVDPATLSFPEELVPHCTRFEYIAGSAVEAPFPDFHSNSNPAARLPYDMSTMGPMCPRCTSSMRNLDKDWKLFMDMLKRFSAHSIAGQLRLEGVRKISFLQNFSPASADDLQALGMQRESALQPNPWTNILRINAWKSLVLYQRLIVLRFMMKGVPVPWPMWVHNFHVSHADENNVWIQMAHLLRVQGNLHRGLPQDSPLPPDTEVPKWYDNLAASARVSSHAPLPFPVAVGNPDAADNGHADNGAHVVTYNAPDANALRQLTDADVDALLVDLGLNPQ